MVFFVKKLKILWPNYQGKNRKNDLLQNLSIKNPFYSKFYADSNSKKRFSFQPLYIKVTVTVTLMVIVTVTVTVTVTFICILLF